MQIYQLVFMKMKGDSMMVDFENVKIRLRTFFVALITSVSIISAGIYWNAYESSQVKMQIMYLTKSIDKIVKQVESHERRGNALVIDVQRNTINIRQIKGALNQQGIYVNIHKRNKVARRD